METLESPFISRFNTNYVPNDKEVSQVQEILNRGIARSREMEEEADKILKSLRSIQEKQATLYKFMDQHRAIISPIRRLAPEILSEIFFRCLVTGRNPAMNAKEAPVLVTQVCRSWRMLALATPRLWAAIHISVPSIDPPPSYDVRLGSYATLAADVTRKRLLGIEQWLNRSGELPIRWSIHEAMCFRPHDSFGPRFLQSLIPYSARWSSLSLTVPFSSLDAILSLPPSTNFPNLRSLRLNGSHLVQNAQSTPTRFMQCGVVAAPGLHEIQLIMIPGDITGYAISWSQLTDLRIEGHGWSRTPLSFQTTSWLLRACPRLISLRFEFLGTPEDSSNPLIEDPTTPIRLPALRNLAICERTSLSPIFKILDLPSLKIIEYHPSPFGSFTRAPSSSVQQREPPSLLAFLTHSINVIQSLTVDPNLFAKEMLINCLRLCPRLKSLKMVRLVLFHLPPQWIQGCTTLDDDFLYQFHSASPENGYLCPELGFFAYMSHGEFSEDALIKFINEKQSGLHNVAKLRRIVLHFTRGLPPSPKFNAELESHRAAGLEAEIVHRAQTPPKLFLANAGVDTQPRSWYSFGVPESF